MEYIIGLSLGIIILFVIVLSNFLINALRDARLQRIRSYEEYLERKEEKTKKEIKDTCHKVLHSKGSSKAAKTANGSALSRRDKN